MTTAAQKPGVFQRFLPLWFVLATLWLVIGRAIYSQAGILTILMIFTIAPMILTYGFVLWWQVRQKHKTNGYQMGKWAITAVTAFLTSVFFAGIFLVDGGSTKTDSYSVFTHLYDVSLADEGSTILAINQLLSGMFNFLAIVLMPLSFIVTLSDMNKIRH